VEAERLAKAEQRALALAAERQASAEAAARDARALLVAEQESARAARERETAENAARLAVQGRAADEAEAKRLAGERVKAEPGRKRTTAALAMAAAVAAAFWTGTLVTRAPQVAPKPAPAAPIAQGGELPLKLDRDLDAFASRLGQK
jgi:hypothetical protein